MRELYVWAVKEPDGREGPVATIIPGFSLGPIPLVTLSRKVADSLRPFALAHAEATGKPVRLVRFTEAETLEKL